MSFDIGDKVKFYTDNNECDNLKYYVVAVKDKDVDKGTLKKLKSKLNVLNIDSILNLIRDHESEFEYVICQSHPAPSPIVIQHPNVKFVFENNIVILL